MKVNTYQLPFCMILALATFLDKRLKDSGFKLIKPHTTMSSNKEDDNIKH
jgi:hypothetical protein